MAVIKTIFKGESLSMLFTFPVAYDMARIEKHEVYIGETAFTGTVSGQTIALKLKSDDTGAITGQHRISLWIDDATLGVRKPYIGDIVFSNTNATPHNTSTSEVTDIIIPIVISETAVTVGDILYNYVKGDKGDTGNYGVVEFVVNENMELEQRTLAGEPLDFSIVDGDLVLNEGGETVNLGTVAIKDTYSYDEKIIGEWVDGKPIYRKVILLSSLSIDDYTINHNLNVDAYIRMDIASNNHDISHPTISAMPLIQDLGAVYAEGITTTSNQIFIATYYMVNNDATYHLILEYTKL